jgi:hypothetical protein
MTEPRDTDERPDAPREGRGPSLRGFARRILGDDDGPPSDTGGTEDSSAESEAKEPRDARARLAGLLETGDKARMEVIRLMAREVRGYLEAMELHKDVHHLLTNYSLEVNASFHLKPLPQAAPPEPPAEPSDDAGEEQDEGAEPESDDSDADAESDE